MNNVQFSVDFIVNKAKTSPKTRGSFNMFFKLNDEIGVKATINKSVRDSNYDRQKDASAYDLAPKTYGKIEFEYLNVTWYGYLTEVVQTIDDILEESGKSVECIDTYFEDEFGEDSEELSKELRDSIGFSFLDNHCHNVGFKNGSMVCIDFDDLREMRGKVLSHIEYSEIENFHFV
jgi:hypothetical protein